MSDWGLNVAGEVWHTAGMSTATLPETAPAAPQTRVLPPFAVVLHNDDHNEMGFVVQTVAMLARVPMEQAFEHTLEANPPRARGTGRGTAHFPAPDRDHRARGMTPF